MKKRTKVIPLPDGNISEIRMRPDGRREIVIEFIEPEIFDVEDSFVLIDAKSLSYDDDFMKWEPTLYKERLAKELVNRAIWSKVKNFYCSIYSPSFDEIGAIQFKPDQYPAVGKSYNEWKEMAKKYRPEFHSRIGSRAEYGAFLGVLIKKLVEKGMSVEDAWKSVCIDSKDLGHYSDSEGAMRSIERTGSRCVCGFFDLSNVCKILSDDTGNKGFAVAGGNHNLSGFAQPLAFVEHRHDCDSQYSDAVGWVILS